MEECFKFTPEKLQIKWAKITVRYRFISLHDRELSSRCHYLRWELQVVSIGWRVSTSINMKSQTWRIPATTTRMLSECWFNRPGREAAQTKSMEELAVGSSWRFVDSKTTETTSSHRTIPNEKILGSAKHISNSLTSTYNKISYIIYSSYTMYRYVKIYTHYSICIDLYLYMYRFTSK